jgi:hypothetical protein
MNHDDDTSLALPSSEDRVQPPFTVGQWVSVASRTSPGINQPGGIGRITAVNDSDHVSIKYVLDGRHEKNVHVQYVQKYSWETTTSTATGTSSGTRLRDRTMLLGRCTYCGSLRADCQSCDFATSSWKRDWNNPTLAVVPQENHSEPPKRRSTPTSSSLAQQDDGNGSDTSCGSSDSSNDRAYERMMRRHRREYVRYKRSVRRAAALNNDGEPLVVTKQSEGGSVPRHRSLKRMRRRDRHELRNETSILATVGAASKSGNDDRNESDDHPMLDLSSNNERSSDSDHSLDHLPLQELAARALQCSVTQHQASFIQPEGDAEKLPPDVLDLTGAVAYPQLLPLLDELLQKMENKDIPQAKRELLQFERAFLAARNDPLAMREQLHTLLQRR